MANRFGIAPGERVLDIGCGDRPFEWATDLADISVTRNSSRFGHPIPQTGLPFCECSVEALPFGDSAFDFVHCAHVLEHVQDPAPACRELMRVARRGYIECPLSWVEFVFHAADHRWLVDHEQHRLIFREILEEEARDLLGIQFAIFDWLKDTRFREYWESVKAVRCVEFYWEGRFEFEIIPKRERKHAGAHRQFYTPPRHHRRQKEWSDPREFLQSQFRRALGR